MKIKRSKEQIEGLKNLKRNQIFDSLCEKDPLLQMLREAKKRSENEGDTSSETYKSHCKQVREIELQHRQEANERAGAKE